MVVCEKKKEKFIYAHLGIIRLFAIWGILDAIVYLIVKDDRVKSVMIYSLIFLVLTLYGLTTPEVIDLI